MSLLDYKKKKNHLYGITHTSSKLNGLGNPYVEEQKSKVDDISLAGEKKSIKKNQYTDEEAIINSTQE